MLFPVTFVHLQNTNENFWYNACAFWPSIDSKGPKTFKPQKDAKNIIKTMSGSIEVLLSYTRILLCRHTIFFFILFNIFFSSSSVWGMPYMYVALMITWMCPCLFLSGSHAQPSVSYVSGGTILNHQCLDYTANVLAFLVFECFCECLNTIAVYVGSESSCISSKIS